MNFFVNCGYYSRASTNHAYTVFIDKKIITTIDVFEWQLYITKESMSWAGVIFSNEIWSPNEDNTSFVFGPSNSLFLTLELKTAEWVFFLWYMADNLGKILWLTVLAFKKRRRKTVIKVSMYNLFTFKEANLLFCF